MPTAHGSAFDMRRGQVSIYGAFGRCDETAQHAGARMVARQGGHVFFPAGRSHETGAGLAHAPNLQRACLWPNSTESMGGVAVITTIAKAST